MNPDEDGRPVTDGQWDALAQIDGHGYAWLVRSKPGPRSITNRMADALARRGFVESSGTRVTLTDAGHTALRAHRAQTGRHPA